MCDFFVEATERKAQQNPLEKRTPPPHTTPSHATASHPIRVWYRTVSVGGEAGAQNGALTVMVGGDQANFDKAEPAMQSYARAVTLLGPAGAGQLTKMVNQICIAGLVQALAEGVNFATRAGLDANLVIDVISKGAAQSWQMENRAKTMIEDKFEFGFAVDWMRKDLGICLDESRRNGARLPVAALVDQFYATVQERGGNRWDTSSLLRLLTTP